MKYFISALLVSALSLPAFAQSEAVKMPTSPLSIVTADKTISLTVEVADEQHELATGYMFREGVE